MPRPSSRSIFLLVLVGWSLGWGNVAQLAAEPLMETFQAPPAAREEAATVTLRDLEQLALTGNPTLRQAAATLAAARGRALQAGLYPNPTVGYVGEEIGSGGAAGEHGIFVSQLIVTGGKLRLSQAAFQQEAVQGQWQALAQQYRVLNGVRIQFYQVLTMQRLMEVEEALLLIAEETLRTTEELFNVGQANRPDVLQAQVQVRQQSVALVTARNRYRAARQELAALVGMPELARVRLEGTLDPPDVPLDWETALHHLLEASPQLHIARADVSRRCFSLQRELVEPIPNIEMRLSTQYDYETHRQQAGVEVGLRLPIFNRNQGNIRTAQADLVRSQAEIERLELALRKRLADVFARYESARNTVHEYRQHILPETNEAFELYLESFRDRRAPWQQVVMAQQDFFAANIDYVQALNEVRHAEVAILGLLLVDGLEGPPTRPADGAGRMDADRLHDPMPEPIGRQGRMPGDSAGFGRH